MSRLRFAPPAEEMHVDVETGLLEFTARPGTDFDPVALRKAIEEAGYGVSTIVVDGKPLGQGADPTKPRAP